MKQLTTLAGIIALMGAVGCGSDDDSSEAGGGADSGSGTVALTTYGEDFIEVEIPAADVEDGWGLKFSKFSVTFKDVSVAGVALADPAPVDLTADSGGEGHGLGSVQVPAGSHKDTAFTIAAVSVEGTATKDAEEKTLAWNFTRPVAYTDCDGSVDVTGGGTASFEITVHADHFLYNSLASEDPKLEFQRFADADADADGAITEAELKAADIGAADVGDTSVTTLWEWLEELTLNLGHSNGEGHCHGELKGD